MTLRTLILTLPILSLLAVSMAYAGKDDAMNDPANVTVLASSSLTNVITDAMREYAAQRNVSLSARYDSAEEIAALIEDGEVADMMILEHPILVRDLKRQGLLDVFSLTELTSNRLALVASKEHRMGHDIFASVPLEKLLDEIDKNMLLVMPDPDSSAAGIAIEQALTELGYWERIKPNVIRVSNVREALYLIAKGKGLGIIYRSDALSSHEVRMLAEFPNSSHDPIVYQVSVVAGEHMEEARDFLSYLTSERGQRLLAKHGFMAL